MKYDEKVLLVKLLGDNEIDLCALCKKRWSCKEECTGMKTNEELANLMIADDETLLEILVGMIKRERI